MVRHSRAVRPLKIKSKPEHYEQDDSLMCICVQHLVYAFVVPLEWRKEDLV